MHVFVTGNSVAYAFIAEDHRHRPAIDGTSEEETAMERYGTIGMHYVQLSALGRSNEGASRRSPVTDVERDNHVFTDRARRTSETEAGEKLSACRKRRSASFSTRQRECRSEDCERTKNCAQM